MAFIICEAPFFVLALTEVSFFSSLAVAFYDFFSFFVCMLLAEGGGVMKLLVGFWWRRMRL